MQVTFQQPKFSLHEERDQVTNEKLSLNKRTVTELTDSELTEIDGGLTWFSIIASIILITGDCG